MQLMDLITAITSIIAVLISVYAIVQSSRRNRKQGEFDRENLRFQNELSILQKETLHSQEQYNRKSVQPLVDINFKDYTHQIRVELRNLGLGPAIITSITISDGNLESENLIDFLPDISPEDLYENFVYHITSRPVANGQTLCLVEYQVKHGSELERNNRERIRLELSKLRIEIEYTDMYGTVFPKIGRKCDWFSR